MAATGRPLLAGRFFRCWRVLANFERRGRVCDELIIIIALHDADFNVFF